MSGPDETALTLDDVRARVEKVRAMAGDDEAAHGEEDDLYIAVLRCIADHHGGVASLIAAEALKTQEIKFCRWYA